MPSKKKINILGATGSIGQSTVDIILAHPDKFEVHLITAHKNAEKLKMLKDKLGARHAFLSGDEGLDDALCESVDLSVCAIAGFAGLEPLMAAIAASKAVAIANKEPLVAAGALVIEAARKAGCKILPIDSEHNAVFQVFDEGQKNEIERIILTASGGPFRTWSKARIAAASLEEALKHPNWDMGAKITIDSASMMNKGLEVIEAHHLFGMPADKIDVLVHTQSVVHSMVEYSDGSILSQMGASDMRTPIAYALGWPERIATPGARLDFKALGSLEFEEPDMDKFPALEVAYACLRAGQAACIAMNAANEIAVEAFLNKEIAFPDIIKIVNHVLDDIEDAQPSGLEDILHLDHLYRDKALRAIQTQRS
jgi:1-deoxy-D-xylulose-5-phosphate reductoisomerase